MNQDNRLGLIRLKTRRRLLFTLITLLLYFSFVSNWTGLGAGLRQRLGDTHITGSLVMFVALIVLLLLLEVVFLWLNLRAGAASREHHHE